MSKLLQNVKTHKIISILIVLFIVLSIILGVSLPVWGADTIQILSHDVGANPIGIAYGGSQIHTSDGYYVASGVEYPAYCLDPSKPGAGEAGSYSVTLSDSITDPKIYGIVLAGYPYKTIDELGVGNDWDAELATKLALRAYLNGWNINNFSVYGSDTSGEYAEVLAAIKNIYNAGIQNTVIPPAPSVTVTATGGNTMTASGDNLVKEYTVTSNVTIKSYTVTLPSNAPTGTKITASDGVTEKTTFNSGEKFMLTIPTSSVTSSSSLTLDVTGEVANQVVLYGTSDNSSYQDYAVTSSPLTFKDANAYATYDVTTTDTTETPTEPTTQPDTSAPPTTTEIIPPDTTTPPPSPSTLEIIKLDAGTNNPLSGTVFEIKNKAGSIVYTGSTDGSGKISLSLDAGYYSITEITPPQGYALDPNSHKDNILLREGETTTVTFTDKKLSSLDITKVDADTGALLPNATIRVAKDGSTDSWDLVTNALGVAVFKDIPDGTYIVTEIVAPAGYILNSTPQTIVLQAGKIAAITLKNNAKPGIVIKKYDENTGLTLAGAEFSIAKMDGQIVYEGITDETGIIRVDNLDAGWYNITEIAAPAGYLKAAESKQVYLEAGKSVEVKFDNRLRPALKIIKVDSQTNQPLAGAKFKVQKTESATVSDYVTDANGEIIIQDLDEAVYSIWEVEAPDGYLCNSEHKDISLEWGTTKQLIFTDTAKPKLEIKKIDEATGKPLANAKFRVTATESKTVSEYVTDNTGTILIPNLNEEIYSVEEIVAPSGYLLETQHKDISLEAGTTKTLVFTDKACPKLEAQKIDSITKLPIAGAKFRVTKTDDLTVSEYTTDDTGKILIDNLEQSTYTVQEITAPDGYIGDNQVKNIQLEWGKTSTLIFENIRKPTLIFTKLDGLTYLPVPNTTYKVEYEDNNGGLVNLGTYRTDSNGQIILPQVNAGWYVITETIPAPGYTLASNPVTRIYLAPGENAYTNFAATSGEVGDISGANIMALSGSDYSATGQETINYPLNSIVIRKVNAVTGELLAGAAFEVRQVSGDISGNSGTIIGRYTTDNSGVIVITGLQPGAYIVAEVQAPANYMLSENSQQQAWLKSDGTSIVEVTFANIPYGSILVTKVDALTGKPLANARFRVTDGSGAVAGNTNGEFITDENGEFLVSNLKPGSYVVTEVEAPANYAIDTTPQTVNVGIDGKTYKVSFKNQPAGTLVIRKMDSVSKEPLANAEFKVTTSGGNVVGNSNGIYKTDTTGIITIPNLPKGSYIIQETKAPDGYILENQSQTIEIDYGKSYTLDFYNNKMSGLQIIKIDSTTKQPLKGVEFAVYMQSGELVGRYVTDANGVIIVDTLSPGWYKAVETKTLDGYLIDDTPKDFQITANQFVQLVFENAPMSSLIIRKVDADTREPLEGAKFTVKTAGGSLIGIYRSDEDGTAVVPTLTPGWYTVTETAAPTGYSLGDNMQTVEIANSKTVTIEFGNRAFGSIVIKKVDEITGAPLTGATFSVYRQAGVYVGEFTTGIDGTISIPNVEPGWYVISETKSPNGYTLDSTAKTVEVKSVVPTVTTFTDKPLSGIQIIKTDSATNLPLADATFKVERPNGAVIGTYKTDVSGKALISGLSEGTYIVSETIPPSGYMLNELPKTVVVVSGKLTTAEFADKPYSGIQINKTDAVTHAPLAGAVFTVQRINGERVGDKYTTDISGKIIIPDLPEGIYIISEIQAPSEYILDAKPQTVEVKSGRLTAAEFTDTPFPYLYIRKIDASTGQLVAGAQFTVAKTNGEVIANITSLASGAVSLKVAPGVYVITEVKPPVGYELNDPVQTIEVSANGNIVYYSSGTAVNGNTATFANKSLNTIEIVKLDSVTLNPLSNAMFTVDKANGEHIGTYRTDSSGKILITDIYEGTYVISETVAPSGYILNESPKSVNVSGGKLISVEFLNKPLSGIAIVKLDTVTHKPLQGASFTVTKANGERIGTFKTEADGKIIISDLDEGVYVVGEITAPDGYAIDETPKNVTVKSDALATVEFNDKPYSGIQIIKTDAVTNAPLIGATFVVEHAGGEKVGTYKTDAAGKIIVPDLAEGTYIVSETIAPSGYVRDEIPKTVTVKSGKLTTVEFTNRPMSGIEITKKDYFTNTALSGATFVVERSDGLKVGEVTTDVTGKTIVTGLSDGTYVVSETVAPSGYVVSESPKTVVVTSGKLTSVTFLDKPRSGIEILKLDKFTHLALSGATFEITRANGEKIATIKTDSSGKAIVSDLDDGVYIISETIAPDGYQIDNIPQTVEVKSGKLIQVEFDDKPLSTLKILKLDSFTRLPLSNVEFTVSKMNGEKIMNEFGSLTFKTDVSGAIYVPRLTDGYYIVTEIKTANGYFLDSEPKTVLVEADKDTVLEVTNIPMSSLLIVKTDEQTGKPLAGVVYDVKKVDGTFVAGDIKDGNQPGTPDNSPSKSTTENGDVTGSYTTDANGRIQINGLQAGEYMVVERKALDNYELDTKVYNITVLPGKQATLQLTNKPKSGIRLTKINSVTKAPIYNVEFMLFDANNKVIGTYYTDNAGVIDFPNDIPAGRYTIRETRAAAGYYLDDVPKTVEFVAGQVTEITWTNTPQMGQIQIQKKSADANEINGLPAGTPLAGAVFEAYNYKTGNLVDRFVSGSDGKAVSSPLPLGRYIIKEVQAPNYYLLSDKELDIEIEFATQIIKMDFLNYSVKTGVSIIKTGNVETMPGDLIRYDIKEVRNTSNVPLTDFYWRDVLPVDAVRLNKIVTGTYNQSLKYKILAVTNKGNTKIIADNLSTTKNNVINCSPASLGLKNDEFIMSFTFMYGTVKSGFAQVETPQIYVDVLKTLPNGYKFSNKVDAGGKYNGEWLVFNNSWQTAVFSKSEKLPKTGY